MNELSIPVRPTGFDPAARGCYGFATTEHLRFADVDANGHINNVAYLVFFENARVTYITQRIPSLQQAGLGVILAHIDIDYRAQLYHPGVVQATACVLEIRRSSILIGQAVFDEQQRCAATGNAVVVAFDRAANRTVPLPAEVRRELEQLMSQTRGDLS